MDVDLIVLVHETDGHYDLSSLRDTLEVRRTYIYMFMGTGDAVGGCFNTMV